MSLLCPLDGGAGRAPLSSPAVPRNAAPRPADADAASCRIAIAVVSAASGIPVETLLVQNRSPAPIAAARQLAMYLAHVAFGLPQAAVARAFNRDRTTVAHACRRVEDLRDRSDFDHRVSQLEACAHWATKG